MKSALASVATLLANGAAGVKHAWRRFPGEGGGLKKGPGGERNYGEPPRDGFWRPYRPRSRLESFSVPTGVHARARSNKYKNHPINPKVSLSGSKNGMVKEGGEKKYSKRQSRI